MLGTKADVDAAVAAARAALPAWSKTTVEERLAVMGRIVEEYKKRVSDLAQSMANEMGAPVSFASTAQVGAGIGDFPSLAAAFKEGTAGNTHPAAFASADTIANFR